MQNSLSKYEQKIFYSICNQYMQHTWPFLKAIPACSGLWSNILLARHFVITRCGHCAKITISVETTTSQGRKRERGDRIKCRNHQQSAVHGVHVLQGEQLSKMTQVQWKNFNLLMIKIFLSFLMVSTRILYHFSSVMSAFVGVGGLSCLHFGL